jgi:hypothetical protein
VAAGLDSWKLDVVETSSRAIDGNVLQEFEGVLYMRNRKLRVIFVASTAAICAVSGASAQLVNSGWEFLQPLGGTVEIPNSAWPYGAVSDMEFWDPDGPGPHGGFMVVGGAFTVSRAEGEIAYTALIDVSSDQWMPLDPSRLVYAAQTSVEVEADGTQSLFVSGGIYSTSSPPQPSRAGLFRQGQWTLFGGGAFNTSMDVDAMTWRIGGERFIVTSSGSWFPQFYGWGSWAFFETDVASFIPRAPSNSPKMMQAVPQSNGGVQLVCAASDFSQGSDGFYRYSGGTTWERIGTVTPIHGAKSFVQRRADGGAYLIAGIQLIPRGWNAEGVVGRWDGTTWTGLTSSVRYRKIVPYLHASGAFSVLVTDEQGVSIDRARVAGPALWDGSQWQSLQYPGAIGEVSTAALGPGAPGQQDIYVGGNLRDPVTGLRTVVARLRWQHIRPSRCFRTDFNHNGVTPEIADVAAFFDALAGATPCQFPPCMSLDFNRNGMFPEEQDVVDFLSAYLTDCGP